MRSVTVLIVFALCAFGSASAAPAMTSKQFVDSCQSYKYDTQGACEGQLLDAEIYNDAANCDTTAVTPEQMVRAVAAWLKTHADVHPENASAAATVAYKALTAADSELQRRDDHHETVYKISVT